MGHTLDQWGDSHNPMNTLHTLGLMRRYLVSWGESKFQSELTPVDELGVPWTNGATQKFNENTARVWATGRSFDTAESLKDTYTSRHNKQNT